MTLVSTAYSIDISENPDLSKLKYEWQDLEAKGNGLSFFHSWEWQENWLQTYEPDVLLVSAKHEGETVALGLFGKSQEIRNHIIRSEQLRLFQTGDRQEDQIWVEFNDFLCHPDHTEEATEACLDALLNQNNLCDEIVISMIAKARAERLLERFENATSCMSSPAFKTDLQQ